MDQDSGPEAVAMQNSEVLNYLCTLIQQQLD